MSVSASKWTGIVIIAATIVGLIAYFADAGLTEANELAGPIGAIVGVIGIGLTVYGMIGAKSAPAAGGSASSPVPADKESGNTVNTITGGEFRAVTILARDVHLDAQRPGGAGHPGASDPDTPRLAVTGDTTNVIEGGLFLHTVVMGRNVTVQLPPEVTPALAGLPSGTESFTGRDAELQAVLAILAPAPPGGDVQRRRRLTVAGMPGVGKTELAIHAARAALGDDWFPGGVLYADLFGYDPARRREAGQVLDGFLRCLGVPGETIPPDGEERARLYCTVLAKYAEENRPILVVIDNVSAAGQAIPLIPGDDVTGVIVTSRESLGMLDMRRLDLGILSRPEAVRLIDRALRVKEPSDDRVAGQPAGAARIAGLCGGLPLALRIVAALLADDSDRPLDAMADDLSDAGSRLEEMSYDNIAVRSAFDLSYRRLGDDLSLLFRLLPECPGPDVSAQSAAVLTMTSVPAARHAMQSLARSSLIEGGNGRWRLHDLIRLFAAEHSVPATEAGGDPADAGSTDGDGRIRARDRILRHFVRMARDGDQWFGPQSGKGTGGSFADRNAALRWLDGERSGLVAAVDVAAQAGCPQIAIDLAGALARYLGWRRRFDDAILTSGTSLKQARLAGRPRDEARALLNLGIAAQGSRRFPAAIDFYGEAAEAYQRAGDRHGFAMALSDRISTLVESRQFSAAIDAKTAAMALFLENGDRQCQALTLNNFGSALRETGRLGEAIAAHGEALTIYRALGDREHETSALVGLSSALQQANRFPEGIEAGQEALSIARETGDRRGEGMALLSLGGAFAQTGRLAEASQAFQGAASAFRETGDRGGEGSALLNLASAWQQAGKPEQASAGLKEAAGIFRETDDPYREGAAFRQLGNLLQAQGRHEEALAAFEQALPLLRTSADDAHLVGIVQGSAGDQLARLRRPADAIPYFRAAVSSFRQAGKPQDEGRALMHLGALLQGTRQLAEAADALRDAAAAFGRAGHPHEEAAALGGLGAVLGLTGHLDDAIDVYRRAIALFGETGDLRGEGMMLGALSSALRSTDRVDEAVTALERAAAVFGELGDERLRNMAEGQLSALRRAG